MNLCANVENIPEHAIDAIQLIEGQPFPQYVQEGLERIYGNVFCTLARLSEEQRGDGIAAYLSFERGTPNHIVLFRLDADRITVMNDYFTMRSYDLERMAAFLLATYPEVNLIRFSAVSVGSISLPFRIQRFNATEDIVISLPATPEIYFASLGRNLRTAIRRAQKGLTVQQPTIDFKMYEKSEVGRERIARLIELSRLRIARKGKHSCHSDRSVAELIRMVDTYGVTLVAQSEGRVYGGVIATQIGSQFQMHVVTHDPVFDEIRLGMLCCYMSICEAVRRRVTQFHLLSGRNEYKFRFRGEEQGYERIIIYRSLQGALVNLPICISTLVQGKKRMAKRWAESWRSK